MDTVDYAMDQLRKDINEQEEAEGEYDEEESIYAQEQFMEAQELAPEGDEDYEFMGFNNKGIIISL
jgi:hypothetical protein